MNKTLLTIFVVIAALIALPVTTYVSYYNKAVRLEANITKLDKSSESLLSNMTMALLDKAKIKSDYAADFKEALRISIGSRYGNDSGLAMKWIKEHNTQLSDKLYLDLSAFIEGSRKDFQNSRDRVMDACAVYEIALNSAISGLVMRAAGYPKLDLTSKCKVITDTQTHTTFQTGMQKSIL